MAHRLPKIDPPTYVSEEQCKKMIDAAITRHNRNASIISMWVGAFCLAAFTDGILRMVGKIPPFIGIDIDIIKPIIERL